MEVTMMAVVVATPTCIVATPTCIVATPTCIVATPSCIVATPTCIVATDLNESISEVCEVLHHLGVYCGGGDGTWVTEEAQDPLPEHYSHVRQPAPHATSRHDRLLLANYALKCVCREERGGGEKPGSFT